MIRFLGGQLDAGSWIVNPAPYLEKGTRTISRLIVLEYGNVQLYSTLMGGSRMMLPVTSGSDDSFSEYTMWVKFFCIDGIGGREGVRLKKNKNLNLWWANMPFPATPLMVCPRSGCSPPWPSGQSSSSCRRRSFRWRDTPCLTSAGIPTLPCNSERTPAVLGLQCNSRRTQLSFPRLQVQLWEAI